MSFVQSEVDICNQSLDRIGAKVFTLATETTTVEGLACARNYSQTRDSLLRSYVWPRATARTTLGQISTIDIGAQPTSSWAVGDVITGIASDATAEILTVTTPSQYEIIHLDGTFEDGETITNATVHDVLWQGVPVVDADGEQVVWYDTASTEQVVCATGYPVVASDTPDFEWDYQYYLPNDFLRLIGVYENDGTDAEDDRFTVEGKRILTNYDTCNIRYVKQLTDPAEWDELFTEIMILRLALKVLPTIGGVKTSELKAEIVQELKATESKARCVAMQEINVSGRQDFRLARYGY
jgi:hypothetical protein